MYKIEATYSHFTVVLLFPCFSISSRISVIQRDGGEWSRSNYSPETREKLLNQLVSHEILTLVTSVSYKVRDK